MERWLRLGKIALPEFLASRRRERQGHELDPSIFSVFCDERFSFVIDHVLWCVARWCGPVPSGGVIRLSALELLFELLYA